ncbi:MAG: hypothetical protein [Wigfec virus K19_179]|nr:MAG: hypothetical protein [Wigfec virus K19_179]
MLLYLVYDKDKQTVSTPLLAPSLEIAETSLKELNPENLSSLTIQPLTTLNSVLDLFLLSIDENKPLPSYLIGRESIERSDGSDPSSECATSL